MYIKNKIKCIIFLLFFSLSFSNTKDINLPGYQRLYYPVQVNQHDNLYIDRILEDIPKKRYPKIKTNYSNKYLVEIQLSSTVVEHSNGIRIYSVN